MPHGCRVLMTMGKAAPRRGSEPPTSPIIASPGKEESCRIPASRQAKADGLSARQVQILAMLQAGKVNKEIANELGIGLGTVKQHVVALFKKLNVRNRAMAVSRGMERQPAGASRLMDDALLEQRPCTVLSFVLSSAAPDDIGKIFGRLLHQTMAASAYDHDAIFLARKDHAGDLIFGIQHASENLVVLSLHAAHRIIETLTAHDGATSALLKGGLTAGLAVASMNRLGGWSGEAIASAAIAQSRALAQNTRTGRLALGQAARDLLQALGPCPPAPITDSLEFAQLDHLPWQTGTAAQAHAMTPLVPPPLLGREVELARLEELLRTASGSAGRSAYLEGETGKGKSRLCHHLATRCTVLGGRTYHWVCQANLGTHSIFALADGAPISLPVLLARFAGVPTARPELWIFDDCHLLPHDDLMQIMRQARLVTGKLALFAGRHLPHGAAHVDAVLQLGRLPASVVHHIVQHHLGVAHSPARVAELVNQATGIPLFAVELSRCAASEALPLSLRLVIAARMDYLKLDRLLLRHVARAPARWSLAQLSRSLHEPRAAVQASLEHAVASGVLVCDDQEHFSFTHPLLRQAVIQAEVE